MTRSGRGEAHWSQLAERESSRPETHPVVELLLLARDLDLGRSLARGVAVVPVSRIVARVATLELFGAQVDLGQRTVGLASWARLEQRGAVFDAEPALVEADDTADNFLGDAALVAERDGDVLEVAQDAEAEGRNDVVVLDDRADETLGVARQIGRSDRRAAVRVAVDRPAGRQARGEVGDERRPLADRRRREARERSGVLVKVGCRAAPEDREEGGGAAAEAVARQDEAVRRPVLERFADAVTKAQEGRVRR